MQVEARDDAADSVRLRGGDDRALHDRRARRVEGAGQVARALVIVCSLALVRRSARAASSAAGAARPQAEPFEITDNSFLVEEAFNQEAGVFQNIFGAVRDRTATGPSTFTQEWPAPAQTHQLSYTHRRSSTAARGVGFGDTLLNYRYQALRKGRDGPPSRRG